MSISETGWTNDFICVEWFKKTFIPFVTARNPLNLPILLILDGHGSHLTDEMVELALKHNIHLYQLPPHTTHKLQPLDVGIFGHVQRKWQDRVDEVTEDTGQGIRYTDAVHHYLDIREAAILPHIVKQSFISTGLNPINPNVFTEKDYAPSRNTSTFTTVPSSFPTQLPAEGQAEMLRIASKLQLDLLVHDVERMIEDEKVKSRFSAAGDESRLDDLKSVIRETVTWLGDNLHATKDEYDERRTSFVLISNPIMQWLGLEMPVCPDFGLDAVSQVTVNDSQEHNHTLGILSRAKQAEVLPIISSSFISK